MLTKSQFIQRASEIHHNKYCYDEKGEVDNQSILDNGADVGILAKDLFGDYIDIEVLF